MEEGKARTLAPCDDPAPCEVGERTGFLVRTRLDDSRIAGAGLGRFVEEDVIAGGVLRRQKLGSHNLLAFSNEAELLAAFPHPEDLHMLADFAFCSREHPGVALLDCPPTYVNHAAEAQGSNTAFAFNSNEKVVFATKDIKAGEELLQDYRKIGVCDFLEKLLAGRNLQSARQFGLEHSFYAEDKAKEDNFNEEERDLQKMVSIEVSKYDASLKESIAKFESNEKALKLFCREFLSRFPEAALADFDRHLPEVSLPAAENTAPPSSIAEIEDLIRRAGKESDYPLEDILQLEELDLSDCQLEGTIPLSLGMLENLTCLDLENNQFTGELPLCIIKMKAQGCDINLERNTSCDIQNSGLTLPSNIGCGTLGNIKELDLQSCSLSGTIPASLGLLIHLEELFLNDNNLTGLIPPSLGALDKLAWLVLSNNQLSGELPLSIINKRSQNVKVDLSGNSGFSLPENIGAMGHITELDLSGYSLVVEASLLAALGELKSLQILYFENNRFDDAESVKKQLEEKLPSCDIYV